MKLTKGRLKEIIVEELQRNKGKQLTEEIGGLSQTFRTALTTQAGQATLEKARAVFDSLKPGAVEGKHIGALLMALGLTAEDIKRDLSEIYRVMGGEAEKAPTEQPTGEGE